MIIATPPWNDLVCNCKRDRGLEKKCKTKQESTLSIANALCNQYKSNPLLYTHISLPPAENVLCSLLFIYYCVYGLLQCRIHAKVIQKENKNVYKLCRAHNANGRNSSYQTFSWPQYKVTSSCCSLTTLHDDFIPTACAPAHLSCSVSTERGDML